MGLVVNPLLSTVTYLTSAGAPTIVLPHVRVGSSGEYDVGSVASALLVPPLVGRHCRFDGRHLHGAPTCFCSEELAAAEAAAAGGAAAAPYERITFCVNVWVNHKPGGCRRFVRPSTGAELASAAAPRLRLAQRPSADGRSGHASLQCGAAQATRLEFALEQTETEHRLSLPTHPRLAGLLASGRVVKLVGSAIEVRPAVPAGEAEGSAENRGDARPRGREPCGAGADLAPLAAPGKRSKSE